MADSISVAAMTRSWRERRHRSLIRRSLACEAVRSASRGRVSKPRYPAVTLAAPLIALPREIVGPAPPETGDPAVPRKTAAGRACARSARTRLISNAPNGHHDFRSLRILLDLGPQSLDVDVDQPGVGRVPVAPDLLEQDLAGEDLAWLAGQRHQEVELQRRQVQRLASPLNRVTRHVDRHVTDGERLGGRVAGAPQPRPPSGDEHLGLERLDDVVVGPGFEAEHDIDGVA